MWWELCNGSSQYLVDLWGDGSASWRKARNHFKELGYTGKFLLIHRVRHGFKVYKIDIKENGNDK